MKTNLPKSPVTNHQSLSSRGFTLIELLVVIGVLGIMAAALVATIDPVEQIRKAQDSNVKNASVEYLNAIVRYYATHQYYPWDPTLSTNATCKTVPSATLVAGVAIYSNDNSAIDSCLTALIDEKELKSGFSSDVNNITKKIYVSQATPGGDISVCFLPTSQSQQVDAGTKYSDKAGAAVGEDCKAKVGVSTGVDCYWCAK